jgi:hypothetical protein
MRYHHPLLFLLACAFLSEVDVRAQSVNFDAAGDLQVKFSIQPGTSATYYSQVQTGGITGGAVDVFATSDTTDTVFFNTSTPSPGGATLTTSLFFRYDAALRNPAEYGFPLVLGFARTPTTSGYTASVTQGIDAGVYLETYNDDTDRMFPVLFGIFAETHAGSTGNLVSGHWYRLTLNLQPIGGTGRATVSVSLVDFGFSGQQALIYFPSFSQSVAAFSGNSPAELYPAFRSFKSGGVDLLDNFSVATGGTLPNPSRLANISTRGRVANADDTLIAGLIAQGDTPKRAIVRAIGPSLSQFGVPGAVADPVLTLFDASGNQIGQNDNWQSTQQQEIIDTHLAPTNSLEAAIVVTLPPANYTAVVTANGTPGVGLVEVYDLQ